MGLLDRLLGRCQTQLPANAGSWRLNGSVVELKLDKAPELRGRGSAVRLEGAGLPVRVLVVHGDDGEWYAFQNSCTHAGRRIDPLPGKGQVQCCSLGRSTWNYRGEVISGASGKPLGRFAVHRDGGMLFVDTKAEA